MFSLIEIIGHLSQALFTIASGFRKMLYLRLALIIAAVLDIVYYLFVSEKPIWSPIIWSIAIILLNAFQLVRNVYEKRFLNLTEDELKMYDLIGQKIDLLHFKKIVRLGNWQQGKAGDNILTQNSSATKLFFLLHGSAIVTVNSKTITILNNGNFIGEMSFLTRDKTSADVSLFSEATLICWEVERLQMMLEKNLAFKHEFHHLLGADIISKIINNNRFIALSPKLLQ